MTEEEIQELLRKANRIEVGKGDILWLRLSRNDDIPADRVQMFYERVKRSMVEAFESANFPVPPIIVSGDDIDAKVISVVDLLGLIGETADVGD